MAYVQDPADDVQVQREPVPFLNREPVAILFVVQTGIALAIGFGLEITNEQMALILTFTGAVLTLITRQQVTPFVPAGSTPQISNPAEAPMVK